MRVHPGSLLLIAWMLVSTAVAQDSNLTRSEVAALKAKLVTVQEAMGADPEGYLKDEEDFDLPTEANPAQGGKYWPITSGIRLRYTDRAASEGATNAEQAAEEFQTKYAAALASGDMAQVTKMMEDLQKLQAAAMVPPAKKENLHVYVQFNQNPVVGIDPDAVILERTGVIALREKEVSSETGSVTVYVDPVALQATEELSKIELRTADGGMPNKTGVYHIVIQLNGTVADIEAWVKTFNFDAMLSVFDSR